MAKSISKTQVVKFIRKGSKGDQGATLRGPQAWSDCANGYTFQAGTPGDTWVDVVLYGGEYYKCNRSHTKTASNYPGSATDQTQHYWRLGDRIELVATKILMTTYALVKNLGVETIEMKDSQGNIKFKAKDGTVQCETGIFRNIDVQSGKVAGFKISGNGLTNDPFNNDAYVIFRNDAMKAFAGIGGNVLPASSGARAVARFENCDTSNHWGLGANYGMLVSSQGARRNIAIGIDGGSISGFSLHNTIMSRSHYMNRGEANIICINTEDANLRLPSMRLCDDGYIVRVKRLGSARVNVYSYNCETYTDSGATRSSIPCIIYDRNDTADGHSGVDLKSEGDASDFVWCRDLIRTVGNKTYYGAWIQYKIPRDW